MGFAGLDRRALLDLDEALDAILSNITPFAETERVKLDKALKRVLAEPLVSAVDVPAFDNSAMDGYAIRSADLEHDERRALPVTQRILAGDTARPLQPGEAARIFTGAPLPEGADAVIMQEDCETSGDAVVPLTRIESGQHVRAKARDAARGASVLEAGHRVRPQDLAIAAATGATHLQVRRRPRLGVFSTGDELAEPGARLGPGDKYSANNQMLGALAETIGCDVIDSGIVRDDFDATCEMLMSLARERDVIISSGGASVGDADHLRAALGRVGGIRFWRIALRPGKPVLFGRVGDSVYLGLPGNPVSSFVTFLLLARPLLLALQGATRVVPPSIRVRAGFDWPKPGSRREFVRVRTQTDDEGNTLANLFHSQDSHLLSSTVWADGLVEIPPEARVSKGDPVRYLPFSGLID